MTEGVQATRKGQQLAKARWAGVLTLTAILICLPLARAMAQSPPPAASSSHLSAAAQPVFTQSVALAQATLVISAAPGDSREVRRVRDLEALLVAAVRDRDAMAESRQAGLADAEARLVAVRATYAAEVDRLFDALSLARDELDRYKADLSAVLAAATPEELALRQRVADGDFAQFDRMQLMRRTRQAAARVNVARLQALEVRVEAETYGAALARLAGDATVRGLLAIWDEAAVLDPTDFWTHVHRARLAVLVGDLQAARLAAGQAGATALNDRDRSVAAITLGDVHFEAREFQSAREAFAQALSLARQIAADEPASVRARHDLSVALERLGDVYKVHWPEGWGNPDALLAIVPAEGLPQQPVNPAGALFAESLSIRRQLATENPASLSAQRSVLVALLRVSGDAAVDTETVGITRALAQADPGSGLAQRDLAIALTNVGDTNARSGAYDEALPFWQEARQIYQQLATNDPSNAQAQGDLGRMLFRLGDAPGSGVTWALVAAHWTAMEANGQVAQGDLHAPDAARMMAGLEASNQRMDFCPFGPFTQIRACDFQTR